MFYTKKRVESRILFHLETPPPLPTLFTLLPLMNDDLLYSCFEKKLFSSILSGVGKESARLPVVTSKSHIIWISRCHVPKISPSVPRSLSTKVRCQSFVFFKCHALKKAICNWTISHFCPSQYDLIDSRYIKRNLIMQQIRQRQ